MSDRVRVDLPVNEDAVFDVDLTSAVVVHDKEVYYGTTEYWNSLPELVAGAGYIYIYSDYQTVDDEDVAGIKVGNGTTLLKDLPFTDEYVLSALADKADKSDTYTKSEVDTIIENLPEPMIFKGTLGVNGTITDLPVASSANEGFTYKVITDGTYQGIVAKVGDVFTSNGSEWVLIPSGDEDNDTWREIKVNGTTVLNSAISSGAVDFVEGDNIEVIFNSTGNKVLIKTKNVYTKTEVDTELAKKAEIDDSTTSLSKTWSSSKIDGLLILDGTSIGF